MQCLLNSSSCADTGQIPTCFQICVIFMISHNSKVIFRFRGPPAKTLLSHYIYSPVSRLLLRVFAQKQCGESLAFHSNPRMEMFEVLFEQEMQLSSNIDLVYFKCCLGDCKKCTDDAINNSKSCNDDCHKKCATQCAAKGMILH